MFNNEHLINKTAEITVAKMSNSTSSTNAVRGQDMASFMQEIYNKLVELNNNDENY